jgi:hypothetical protein
MAISTSPVVQVEAERADGWVTEAVAGTKALPSKEEDEHVSDQKCFGHLFGWTFVRNDDLDAPDGGIGNFNTGIGVHTDGGTGH